MLGTIDRGRAATTSDGMASGRAATGTVSNTGSEFAAAVARSGAPERPNTVQAARVAHAARTAHTAIESSSSNAKGTAPMIADASDAAEPDTERSTVPQQARANPADANGAPAEPGSEQDADDGEAPASVSVAGMPPPNRALPVGKIVIDRSTQATGGTDVQEKHDPSAPVVPDAPVPQLPNVPAEETGGTSASRSGNDDTGKDGVQRAGNGPDAGGNDGINPIGSLTNVVADVPPGEARPAGKPTFGMNGIPAADAGADPGTGRTPEPAVLPPLPVPSDPGTTVAMAPASASGVASQPTAAATPAEQVGAAMVDVVQRTDGSGQISLSLHPKDLGHVRVEVEKAADGSMNVVVTASEPSTLRSLQGDQAHLHAALDAAGHPAADRHVSFVLDPATGAGTQDHDRSGGGNGVPDRSNGDGGSGSRSGQNDRGNRPGSAQGRWTAEIDDAGWGGGEAAAPSRRPQRMLINVLA